VPDPSLLILIPAYNEERASNRCCAITRNFFRRIIPANSRSSSCSTAARTTRSASSKSRGGFSRSRALEFREPIGKGGALIEGFKLASLGDLIGYVDADGATPPRAFLELVKNIGAADCVVGSRWLPGAVIHQEQTTNRQFASRVFHFIVQLLFWLNIHDTQCGAKVMKREVVEKIHPFLRIADMAFDINLLVSIKRAGFRILEVPTEWTDKAGSKVTSSLFRSSLTMFLSVVRIRLIYWPRIYKLAAPVAPARRLDLQKTARAAAVVRAKVEMGNSKLGDDFHATCHLPTPMRCVCPTRTTRKCRAAAG
jgi:glycosyltransferase involved in cell wall biosynthesis